MSKKAAYLLVLLTIVLTNIQAQTYNFINYNVGEGLEQSDILCVEQATNGYLLYGSNGGGLGYYDGYNFYSVKEKNGLANNVVFSVSLDDDQSIWCATNDGVSQLTPNLNKVIITMNKGMAFYCSYYDKDNKTHYFGTKKGIYSYNHLVDSLEKLETGNDLLNESFINFIYSDSKQNIWVGTRENGVFKMAQNKVIQFSQENGLPSNYIKTIIESNNKIWVGSLMGLSVIENDVVTDFELPNDAEGHLTITSVAKYKGLLVFGALNNHLYFVNPATNNFRWINAANGFGYKKVWSTFTDIEGNLWFGTLGQGLVKFNATFTYFNQDNGLLNSYINAIYCDGDETWLGYKGNGINIVKDNVIIKAYTPKELGSSIVNRIARINGKIYVGTNSGLSVYNNDRFESVPFSNNQPIDVYSIYQDKKTVYIGTKYGLCQLINDTVKKINNTPEDFIFDIINYKQQLLLASNNGYYTYSGGKFKLTADEQNFSAGRVRSFAVDNQDHLWIGTDEGIYVKVNNDHIRIDEQKGLSSDNVYFLQFDNNSNIWAGTNKGVDRINTNSFYDFSDQKKADIQIRNYSKSEGLVGVESNLNAIDISKTNQLWIGTINGVYLYNQQGDEINKKAPNITLNNIKLNFNNVNWKDYSSDIDELSGLPKSLELDHGNNNFIFEYVGVSLKNPEKVYYQYRLTGLDEDWLPLTQDRKAVYTALSPGDYEFVLQAKNNDNVWTKEPITFSFTILPPWYQTKWFYISAILSIIIAIYLIIYIRTRNLKRTQLVLTQKVEERTKELREEKEKVEHVNIELEEQKKVIEVVNKNITDSINYAKKIQEAILPRVNKLNEFKDNFSVLYLPKDVVSGDFYWFEKVDGKLVMAAADCTGHGVPGAFMSMIGVNNLNQIILENKVTDPAKILSELNIAIKKVLQQEDKDSESKDGMDISICCFDLESRIIQYAGAFRPLLYIRNGEMHELKASRQPIGGSAPFNFKYDLNEFEFFEEDVFYMFSDGYPDQFGGPKGKKFMNKQLKDLLIKNHQKTPSEQREILKKEFFKWMNNEDQVDDILVMCIKF